MSSEDNHKLNETAYLLQSPANARRLLESIEEVEKASIREVSINSLLKPHKQRNLGLLKDNIKSPEDFGQLDDEITELFTD
jgi:hypothetical protein